MRLTRAKRQAPLALRLTSGGNPGNQGENPKYGRIHWMYGMVFVSLSVLVLRLGYLQIARGEEFRAQASTSMLTHVPVLPSRGWIYDTHGLLLAYDQPSFTIRLTRLRKATQDYAAMAALLAPVCDMRPAELLALMQHKNPGQTVITLLANANTRQVAFVREHQSDLPGVSVEVIPQRAYPYGDLADHVLGYVRLPTEADINAAKQKDHYTYLPDQWLGKDGVEKQYESLLRGLPGDRVVETNSRGVPIHDFGLDPAPQAGNSLQLTLDAHLQAEAQQIVVDELAYVRAKYHYDPKEADVVMLDPRDGGVLALVSYPYYNPQWFTQPKQVRQYWNYIWNPSLTPTVNHAIASFHYPGSTVKPVNLLAALETGVIRPSTTLPDPGYAEVGNDTRKDWMPGGHGRVDPVRALQVSCDTYMYHVGMWMAHWWNNSLPEHTTLHHWLTTDHVRGLNTLFAWEERFGLGQLTGIDLPGEQKGVFYDGDSTRGGIQVPYPLHQAEASLREHGQFPNHGLLYNNAIAAIGQSQQFTPMQLAVYAMTLANGGKRLQPHVLKAVYPPGTSPASGQGQVVPVKVQAQVALHPANLRVIQAGMYAACNKPGGTAYKSFANAPYRAAGKTGTAQLGQGRVDVSLFVGYAPADHPQVAVAVMVPGGGESGETAVPIARQLFDAYFKEHHEFFPATQWTDAYVPGGWFRCPAYTLPTAQALARPAPERSDEA
ncbi:MAG: penicillin-binding protein 2 [Alicyclobacillus sp.]|nr:penicillin-binding protein 2 [Alicyclobacillus sp.]